MLKQQLRILWYFLTFDLSELKLLREYDDDRMRFSSCAYFDHQTDHETESTLSRMTQLAHGIEKGLSFREPKRPFFLSKIDKLIDATTQYLGKADASTTDKRLEMVSTSLASFLEFHLDEKGDSLLPDNVQQKISELLERINKPKGESLLVLDSQFGHSISKNEFEKFIKTRRSIRNFSNERVDNQAILKCVELAMHSPSVCNRQSWRVKILDDKSMQEKALSFQTGNVGFGHEASHVLVVGCDLRDFYTIVERNQAFVDGGLFCMSLVYALHAHGIGSCCLNWCVASGRDRKFRQTLGLEEWFRTTMLIAVGKRNDDISVPYSIRRSVEDIAEIL